MSTDFSVRDVLEWARTKPADERYRYGDIFGCALCQFLKFRGIAFYGVGGSFWMRPDYKQVPLPEPLRIALREPGYTFGGLVERLEALLPDTPVTQTDWAAIDAYLTESVEA